VSEAATDRIAHTIAAQSKGGYAQNSYRLERHGIDPDEVEARFGDYMSYFDIAPEAVAPRFKGSRRGTRTPVAHPQHRVPLGLGQKV
jgi:hypothetical protein